MKSEKSRIFHYTYQITEISTQMKYIGCRSSERNPEDDLGLYYFSSIRDKSFVEKQKDNPEDYLYDILGVFENREDAIEHEISLHKIYDVSNNKMFYNVSKQTSTGWDNSGFVSCRDIRTGEYKRVAKSEFDSSDFLVGTTNGHKEFITDEWREKSSKISKGRVHITNGSEDKMIFPEQLDHYLSEGWCKGRSKIKGKNSGKIHITNGKDRKQIYPSELSKYRDKGWRKGLPTHEGRIHINNGQEGKFIPGQEFEKYEKLGWRKGMLPNQTKA